MRFFSVIFITAGLIGLGAQAGEAAATPVPVKPPTDFKSLDTDGDGRISLAEFTAPAVKQRAATRAKPRKEETAATGRVSHDDILSPTDSIEGRYSPEVFQQLDINHDKYLSPAELEALFVSAHNISQP